MAQSVAPNEQQQQEVREAMKQYWEMHTADGDPTEDTMMLMNDAREIDIAERREILSLLPDFSQKRVVELGCGIGRFTRTLAKEAKHVLAVDFLDVCIAKNQEANADLRNITFLCKDVTALKLSAGSHDMVFSNWLMMYLGDEEVAALAARMLAWVKPGGYIFFRESCTGGPSGDKPRPMNPTFYRSNDAYTQLFLGLGLTLVHTTRVRCYEEMKNKVNQYVWLFQKVTQ